MKWHSEIPPGLTAVLRQSVVVVVVMLPQKGRATKSYRRRDRGNAEMQKMKILCHGRDNATND